MPKRKNISNDLNGATVSAHEFGKSYKAISKHSEDHHPTVRILCTSGQPLNILSRQVLPRVINSLQGQALSGFGNF